MGNPREAALERAKHSNPKFARFMDKLLLIAGALVDNEKVEDDIVATLLGSCNDIGSRNLTLVSIPCKRKLATMKEGLSATSASSSSSASDSDSDSDINEEEDDDDSE